jgi:hypothetical protein
METDQRWIIPLPKTTGHRHVWSEHVQGEQLLFFNGTRDELLQLADNILGAAEVQ